LEFVTPHRRGMAGHLGTGNVSRPAGVVNVDRSDFWPEDRAFWRSLKENRRKPAYRSPSA